MCVCIVIYASTYTVWKHGYNVCEKHVGEERKRERERERMEREEEEERERERERCMAML